MDIVHVLKRLLTPHRRALPPDPFGPPATHEAADRPPAVAPTPGLPPTIGF